MNSKSRADTRGQADKRADKLSKVDTTLLSFSPTEHLTFHHGGALQTHAKLTESTIHRQLPLTEKSSVSAVTTKVRDLTMFEPF
jgi:hypothetical protein